jgi:hypothetical protein
MACSMRPIRRVPVIRSTRRRARSRRIPARLYVARAGAVAEGPQHGLAGFDDGPKSLEETDLK